MYIGPSCGKLTNLFLIYTGFNLTHLVSLGLIARLSVRLIRHFVMVMIMMMVVVVALLKV